MRRVWLALQQRPGPLGETTPLPTGRSSEHPTTEINRNHLEASTREEDLGEKRPSHGTTIPEPLPPVIDRQEQWPPWPNTEAALSQRWWPGQTL